MQSLRSLLAIFGVAAITMASPALAETTAPSPFSPSRWSDIAQLPDLWSGNWIGLSDMTDGPMALSFTPTAEKYIRDYKPIADIRFAEKGCKTPGMPFVMQIAATPIKFMAEPGMIAIYIEGNSQTRFIHMQAKHSSDVNPTFLGESIGHWEGDTLVVDTVGFVPETTFQYSVRDLDPGDNNFMNSVVFGPHGPNLHFVERMRLSDQDTLEIKTITYDESVFTSPKQTIRIYRRQTGQNGQPMEFVCSDEDTQSFDPKTNSHTVTAPEEAIRHLNNH